MTEPSAWAKAIVARMGDSPEGPWPHGEGNECHTYGCPVCCADVALALDAAWRAGAEAMRRRIEGKYAAGMTIPMVDDPVHGGMLVILLPAPGEER